MWISNESELLKEIPEGDRAMEVNLNCGGYYEKRKYDAFTFKNASAPFCKENEQTKRSFLKNIPTLFDPFVFLSPYIVQGKVLLQEIWMTGLDWDDPLPLDISKKAMNWLKGLEALSSFQVLRRLQCPEEDSEVTFYVFNDASEKAWECYLSKIHLQIWEDFSKLGHVEFKRCTTTSNKYSKIKTIECCAGIEIG